MDIKNIEKAYDILCAYDVIDRVSVVFGVYKPLTKEQFIAEILANEKLLKSIIIFLDMDNTLVRFSFGRGDDNNVLEKMFDKGFFKNLEPMKHIDFYEVFCLLGIKVYILSACIKSPYTRKEKRESLHRYMPFIPNNQILFCNVGVDKAQFAMKKTGLKSLENAFLIDDYKENLIKWAKNGGYPIKKAMSFKLNRPYPTLLDHKDSFDMIFSIARESRNKKERNNVYEN